MVHRWSWICVACGERLACFLCSEMKKTCRYLLTMPNIAIIIYMHQSTPFDCTPHCQGLLVVSCGCAGCVLRMSKRCALEVHRTSEIFANPPQKIAHPSKQSNNGNQQQIRSSAPPLGCLRTGGPILHSRSPSRLFSMRHRITKESSTSGRGSIFDCRRCRLRWICQRRDYSCRQRGQWKV